MIFFFFFFDSDDTGSSERQMGRDQCKQREQGKRKMR